MAGKFVTTAGDLKAAEDKCAMLLETAGKVTEILSTGNAASVNQAEVLNAAFLRDISALTQDLSNCIRAVAGAKEGSLDANTNK